ncbi:FAD/NAD(P)-binding protein [Streptomyces sp. NPDC102282]|uniref:FAD/NAD(P)-binding protein n=1 Tax=Streptomyces sp. NPDC102282 TaxID=3366154 RepID=UPI0038220394
MTPSAEPLLPIPRSVCIVGVGPRGLSVLERLCANARTVPDQESTIHVHLVDPFPPGAGQVWRTRQSHHLLMNTVACQITVFTDPSVALEGPYESGPSLYEWAVARSEEGPDGGLDDETLAEARDLGPDTYPTRAFYGHYLRWAFAAVVAGAPPALTVTVHPTRAVALDDEAAAEGTSGPRQVVRLEDGTVLGGLDAVVLAQGHVPALDPPEVDELAGRARAKGLTYFPPSNPADTDLRSIAPREPVLLRGLGLNFFDYMALLTTGRGGTFVRSGSLLVYRPSGNEPRLYAGSRRGIPYHARGENEKGAHGRHMPLLLTPERIAELRSPSADGPGADFREEVWPLVAKEVETVYYRTLLEARGRHADARAFAGRWIHEPWRGTAEEGLLEEYGIGEKDRWSWELIARPQGDRRFVCPDDFRAWLLELLQRDAAEARAGNVSGPLKAALDVMRDLRNEIRLVVDHAGLHGDSHRDDLDRWYTPLNAFLSIGPPTRRIEEMAALLEAGVLTVLGPGLRVDVAEGGFAGHSPAVPGSEIRTSVLIEARLPDITLTRTADPLLRYLLATGACRTHRIATRGGGSYESDGLAVSGRPYHLLDREGRPHPRRFAFGVPTEAVHWVTAAGIRPGVNSVTLTDADAIARAALARAGTDLSDSGGLSRTMI